ncbi:unnamed protein product [Rotaria sp. Silwood1]|nr:unnamed protein product [Rotaria sp. Silwood1]CAF1673582.1 unnamed protein product [Rotaria sp. Silwood1]
MLSIIRYKFDTEVLTTMRGQHKEQRGLNNGENIILAAFNRAKELVSNLNILPSLKKCNACELNGLSKNIFDSIRFNINSDTYSATDADSSSDSESDYDDETMESNEFNSDLINVNEEDKDAATTVLMKLKLRK